MKISIRSIIKGFLCYTPLRKFILRRGTGGTNSARYCYSVWFRHLDVLLKSGLKSIPKVVAEIGPGDSLGTGLAALLTGADKYYAFDAIAHLNFDLNIKIFTDLHVLFKDRTSIPDEKEFPELKPTLKEYSFPEKIIDFSVLDEKFHEIYKSLIDNDEKYIKYIVPWNTVEVMEEESVDLIFSQAVMEHVENIEEAYFIMYKWLKNGGYISHQIDFRAHETHKVWNGHWKYSNFIWKIIMQGRSYPINRKPLSLHIRAMKNVGFEIVNIITDMSNNGYKRENFRGEFYTFEPLDYFVTNAHIVAKK